ncbi:MAG: TIGR01620 family protein [Magnetococcales bacterium]|nr:TIGR01620 family protein [Magnetococcales bacterium]
MSAQVKWVPPIELAVDQALSEGGTSKKAAPILLSAELREGDTLLSREQEDSCEEAELLSDGEAWGEERRVEKSRSSFRWFVSLGFLFLLAVVVQDTVLFLEGQFIRHPALGWSFSLLASGAGLALSFLIVREIRTFRSVKQVQKLQNQATLLRQEGCYGKGVRFATGIMDSYKERQSVAAGWQQFQDVVDVNLGDREILALFSSHVLIELDKKAYDIVVKNATISALLTAISPMAWLDAMLFFWRNVRMMRQIAHCYGFRPGFFGSLLLTQEVLQGMVASAATDFLTDEAAESIGSSVTAVLFAKAGQGMANGLLSARLGVQAMRFCRPIPFLVEEKPSLRRVRSEMIDQVKKRLG